MASGMRIGWISCAAVLMASAGAFLFFWRGPVDPAGPGPVAENAGGADSPAISDASGPAERGLRGSPDLAGSAAGARWAPGATPAGQDAELDGFGGPPTKVPAVGSGPQQGPSRDGIRSPGEPSVMPSSALAPGEESLSAEFDALLRIAESLADDPLWMGDPPPDLQGALANLIDSTLWLSEDPRAMAFLEMSLDGVLEKTASALAANDDPGGAQLAQEARTAMANGRLEEAHDLVREMVDWYYQ